MGSGKVYKQADIHLLHVDDEPGFAELTAERLTREDDRFTVETATSADDGLEILDDFAPDCIISDYDMPGTDGIDFLRAVREEYPELPFILYTGQGSENVASEAISAGVTDYLQKTTDSSQYTLLANRIKNAVEKYRTRQELKLKNKAMDEAPTGITITDPSQPDNPIVYANEEFTEITGYDHSDIRGRNCRFLQGEATEDEPVSRMREAIDNHDSVQVELRNYRRNGSMFWNEVWIAPLRDDTGEVTNFVGFQQDVTTRKARDQQPIVNEDVSNNHNTLSSPDTDMEVSDPYRTVIDNFPQGIVFLYEDRDDLRYTFVRGDGLDEIGLTQAELEGSVVSEGRPPDIKERVHEQYRKALEGETVTFEVEAEGRTFRIHLQPIYDDEGEIGCGGGIVQDITEQRVYQQELEQANERLSQFTDLLFHDLRNPLNVAQGRLDLLREDCDSEHIEHLASALERIESLTATEPAAITELDPDEISSISLATVASDAWDNVVTKSAELRLTTDQQMAATPDELRRLFENLFRNAVEHGGDDVTVRVGPLETGFYVEDDGTGIPEARREEIFRRGVSHSEQGTGLGLFIVQNVVETHGWDIRVTESPSGGARFEITGVESTAE